MQFLIDFFPALAFVATYFGHETLGVAKDQAIYPATAVLMGATVVQLVWVFLRQKKLPLMNKVVGAMVLGFGALTLALHDPRFVHWKPTLINVGLAIALLATYYGWKKNPLQLFLSNQLTLPDVVWYRLMWVTALYFLFMAGLNAVMVLFFTEEAWAASKLWGFGFTLIFVIIQVMVIAPHMKNDAKATD